MPFSDSLLKALRVEWARSRSRAFHFYEEVDFLCGEMQNSIRFCRWAHSRWEENLSKRIHIGPQLLEGLQAYAHERMQAEKQFEELWTSKWDTVYDRASELVAGGFGTTELVQDPAVVEVEVEDPADDI